MLRVQSSKRLRYVYTFALSTKIRLRVARGHLGAKTDDRIKYRSRSLTSIEEAHYGPSSIGINKKGNFTLKVYTYVNTCMYNIAFEYM